MRPSTTTRAAQILLVDDSPADVRLTQEAFGQLGIARSIHVVTDGDQALDFLLRRAGYTDSPRPDLVLLDLNLPMRSGLEVLAEIKSDPDLKSIPVVVLTTSTADDDARLSYAGHANCVVVKPVDLDGFLAAIAAIEQFWLNVVRLPPQVGHDH